MINAGAAAQQGLPDLKNLIKPDHIRQMKTFPEEQRDKYIVGVTDLWTKIENSSPESEEYRKTCLKLYDVTKNIRVAMMKYNGGGAAHQNGVRPGSSGPTGQPGQPAQQDARPPGLGAQNGSQAHTQETFSPEVIAQVQKLNIVAPPHLNGNENAQKQWIRDAQRKYAENLSKGGEASKQLKTLHQAAASRAQQGKPLNQQETENYQNRAASLEQKQREHRSILQGFQAQQDTYRAQQAHGQGSVGVNLPSSANSLPQSSAQTQNALTAGSGPPYIKQEPQGQPHTVSSAVDAARSQPNPAARSAMSPQKNTQPTQPSLNQHPATRPQPNAAQTSHSHPSLNVNTTSGPPNQHNSPRVAPSQSTTMAPHEPVALSHSAAVDAARSYSQPSIPQQTPQSSTHGPSDQRNQTNHAKMPIPKDLNLPPTHPVSMGPSRPTLTNGPLTMGPIGQPAIQRHPGYVLEGEGERVLSKKKLEELVRQVTGGTGGEGEEGEGLTAEVEEV